MIQNIHVKLPSASFQELLPPNALQAPCLPSAGVPIEATRFQRATSLVFLSLLPGSRVIVGGFLLQCFHSFPKDAMKLSYVVSLLSGKAEV